MTPQLDLSIHLVSTLFTVQLLVLCKFPTFMDMCGHTLAGHLCIFFIEMPTLLVCTFLFFSIGYHLCMLG